MLDFQNTDRLIANNSPSISEMIKLITLIIDRKKFIFEKNEVSFDTGFLIENKVLITDSGKFLIGNNEVFYYISYLEFSKRFSFSPSDSLEELFVFFEKISENLRSGNIQGYSNFLSGVNSIAFCYQHCNFKPDYISFIDKILEATNNRLHIFTDAFARLLPYQNISQQTLLEILRKLYILHEFDKPDIVNFNIVHLNSAIEIYSSSNSKEANLLLDKMLSSFDKVNESIAVPVISGLRKVDNLIIQKLEHMAKSEQYQPLVVVSMTQSCSSNEEINTNLRIIKSIENNTKHYQLQLPAFYIAILKNGSICRQDVIINCFNNLKQLVVKSDLDFPIIVLRSLVMIKNHEREKTDLLLLLIDQDHFDLKLTYLIAHVFSDFLDYKLYFEFLFSFAFKSGFKLDERIFEPCAIRFREKHPEEVDINLLNFLIHDDGKIRWMGQRLYSTYNNYRIKLFKFDILKLSPKSQFKLFTSILSILSEPMNLLRPLLPLVQTQNDFVKEAFICRLEILGEDYGSQVTKVLEDEWQNKNSEQEHILNRVQNYIIKHSAEMNERNSIKELNPVHTQSLYLNSFLNGYQKVFQRNVNENVEKNSLLHQLASTTILARGGGWKHQETGQITQLSKFASRFILPTSYFVSPDNYEWDKHKEMNEKWDKFLIEWEAIL